MNDYVFRGITQSNHKPSVAAYFEPRYNVTKDIQLYVGIAGESIKFANDANAEIDFYGGVRPTFGPLALRFWLLVLLLSGRHLLLGRRVSRDCAASASAERQRRQSRR